MKSPITLKRLTLLRRYFILIRVLLADLVQVDAPGFATRVCQWLHPTCCPAAIVRFVHRLGTSTLYIDFVHRLCTSALSCLGLIAHHNNYPSRPYSGCSAQLPKVELLSSGFPDPDSTKSTFITLRYADYRMLSGKPCET